MPAQELRQRVNRRLEELYRRHLLLHDHEVVGYYDSGFGYSKPEQIPEAAQKPLYAEQTQRGIPQVYKPPLDLPQVSSLGAEAGRWCRRSRSEEGSIQP